MVGSVYGVAQYICSYMCKDEPQELKQLIAANLARLPENSTQCQRLLKIGNTLISHHVLSAQEAVYHTTGLHLCRSTCSSVFVNTARPEKRTKIFRPTHQLCSMAGSDTNVFQAGLHECYAAHPPGDPFDDMSLANFAVWCAVSRTPLTEASLATSSCAQLHYELQNSMGTIYLRHKQACLRIPTFSPESHGTTTTTIFLSSTCHGEMRGGTSSPAMPLPGSPSSPTGTDFAIPTRTLTLPTLPMRYSEPCRTLKHLDINDEGTGLDPVYNQELYLDPSATAAANPGGEGVGDVVNPDNDHNNDFLTDLHDGLTLNAMSRR